MRLSNIINFESFRNEGAEWRAFWNAILAVFLIPQFLLLGALEILAWRVGETVPQSIEVRRQIEHPDLIWGSIDNRDHVRFKLDRLKIDRPDVIAMGTSCMARFRSAMFHPYSFYNMARLSWSLTSFSEIVDRFPKDYSPKVIILGIDFSMFNPDAIAASGRTEPVFEMPYWKYHLMGLSQVFVFLCKHPQLLWQNTADPFYHHPSAGLQAVIAGYGFRKDGSEQTPGGLLNTMGNDPHMLEEFQRSPGLLGPADDLGAPEFRKFEEFVSLAKSKGIAVIAVQMPVYTPVVETAEKDPRYENLRKFESVAASGYFERLGVIYFDFLKFKPYGDDYRYFQDTVHSSEVVSTAILQKMITDPRVKMLLPKLDGANLQTWLDKDAHSTQHIYLYYDQY